MPKFDSKFLTSLPSSKYYAESEILLTSSKINWKSGSLFRRELNPTAGQITRFKFSNVENFREIILTVVNESLTENAEVYFPLGYWTDGEPISIIPPQQRMVMRITSTDGAIYYEASNELALFAYPVTNPISIEQFPAISVQNGNGAFKLVKDEVDPDVVFVGCEYDSKLGAILQQQGLVFDVDGTYDPEISSKLSDVMIKTLCFNSDMTIAYVWGAFGSYYNTVSIDAPVYADSNCRLLAVDLETGDADPVYQFNNGSDLNDTHAMVNDGDEVIMRGNSQIGSINAVTGTVSWLKQISAPFSFSLTNTNKIKFKVVGNYIYALARGYDNVAFGKDVVIRINKTTGVIDNAYHTAALALTLPDTEHPCWDVDDSGRSVKIYASVYNSGTALYDAKLVINDNGTLQVSTISDTLEFLNCEITSEGINVIQRGLTGGNISKMAVRNFDGTFNRLITNLSPVSSFSWIGVFKTFQDKIYMTVDGSLSRFSLQGTLETSFSPISIGQTNSFGVTLGDVLFNDFSITVLNKYGDGFSSTTPIGTKGQSVLTRKIAKVKLSTGEILGTVLHDNIQSTDNSDMITIPTVADRLFVKNGSGYKVINTVTMTQDTSWGFDVRNGSVSCRRYADGYVYMMSDSNNVDVYDKVGTLVFNDVPKGSMWRLDVATKDLDPLFLVTTFAEVDPNGFPSHIENTTDYLYITYCRSFSAGSLIQVKKSDWTAQVVSGISIIAGQTQIKVHELESNLILLVAPNRTNGLCGINGSSFVVIDETDLSITAFSAFNDTFSAYQYDDEGNVYYFNGTDLKLKKCDLFTMLTQVKLTLGYNGTTAAKDGLAFLLGDQMELEAGMFYFFSYGYYNRQVVSGMLKYNPTTNKLEA